MRITTLRQVLECGIEACAVTAFESEPAGLERINLETAIQPTKHAKHTKREGVQSAEAFTFRGMKEHDPNTFPFVSLVNFVGSTAFSRIKPSEDPCAESGDSASLRPRTPRRCRAKTMPPVQSRLPIFRQALKGLLLLMMSVHLFGAPGDLRWKFNAGRYVRSTPAIGPDGAVYFVGGDGIGYALNGATGKKRWQFQGVSPILSPCAGPDGRVYFGLAAGGLASVATSDGAIRTVHRTLEKGFAASPSLGIDGRLYLASENGRLYSFLTAKSESDWVVRVESDFKVFSSPAVGADGTVYVGTPREGLSALEPSTGQALWAFRPETTYDDFGPVGGFHASPALGGDGTVFIGSTDGRFYAFDGATGSIKWTFETESRITSSAAIGSDGSVYFGSDDGRVYSVEGATGKPRWRFSASGSVHSSPALTADGLLYIGSYDRKVYALEAATGAKRWEFTTGGPVLGSAAVAEDGTVLIGSFDGSLYALEGTAALEDGPWPKFRRDARNSGSAEPHGPPRIVAPPVSRFVSAGSQVTLAAIVGGSRPMKYQWYFEGEPIAPANGSSFTIARAGLEHAGSYRLIAENAEGRIEITSAIEVGFSLDLGQRRGGTIQAEPAQDLYRPGSKVVLTAKPEEGRRFLGWLGNLEGDVNPIEITMDRNLRLAPEFELAPGETIWEFAVRSRLSSPPTIGPDGTVFVSAEWPENALYAQSGDTGRTIWRFQESADERPLMPVLSADGILYLKWGGDRLIAVDAADGKKLWTYQNNGLSDGGPPALGPNGMLYVRLHQAVDGLDRKTGERKWRYLQGNSHEGDSPTASADGKVFFTEGPYQRRVLVVLDGFSGELWWRFGSADPVMTSPSIGADGTAYVCLGSGWLVALNAGTRSERWRTFVGTSTAPIIGPGGALFIARGDALLSLNPETGKTIWRADTSPDVVSSPSLVLARDGTLYGITHSGPKLLAFDAESGRKLWEAEWPLLSNHVIEPWLALSHDANLYMTVGWPVSKLMAIHVTSGLAQSPWPKFRGDMGNTAMGKGPLQIATPRIEGESFSQSIQTLAGFAYHLEFTNSLGDADWKPLATVEGDGSRKTLADPSPTGERRFYRVRFETSAHIR